MSETVTVPKKLLEELREHLERIDEILATLEELMDKEGLERIRKATDEYKRGEYVAAEKPEDISRILEQE